MSVVDFRTAISQALDEELARDESVLVFGEDVAAAGGVWATTPRLLERHGPERVFDTPISELALAGTAFGSAVCGKRPVIEIMFGDFLMLAMDSLVNQAAKWWYVSNEQLSVPLVVRSAVGGGLQFGAVHSQMPISWFMGVPGLKIVCPSTPGDAKGLLKQSIRDNNPVLFLEHKRLYSMTGETTEDVIPIGVAKTVRAGQDITLVSAMRGVHDCLAAADELAASGISAEVIDLRTLRPLDMATVMDSVKHTNRLLVVEEGPRTGGWAGEVLARTLEDALQHLDIAWRLATPDTPIPYSHALEDAFLPSRESIVASVRSHLGALHSSTGPVAMDR
jgi:acetoin:2,6-dichlorophenolindophenol oxidoreductase subunit beta